MRRADGYAVIILPGDRPIEHDTILCGHCQNISLTKPVAGGPLQVLVMRSDGTHYLRDCAFCRNCFRHICPRCDGKPCVPFEKRIDREEKAARKIVLP